MKTVEEVLDLIREKDTEARQKLHELSKTIGRHALESIQIRERKDKLGERLDCLKELEEAILNEL